MNTRETSWQSSIGDKFMWALAALLVGYALLGKSFAYLGAPPLYVGELTLLLGVAALVCCRKWTHLLGSTLFWLIVAMMLWGAAQTLPYISRHGMNALRDAVIWGYAVFAIIVAQLLIEKPQRLATLYVRFGRFVPMVLWAGPVLLLLSRVVTLPDAPWSGVPLIHVKGGDYMVHLCAAMAMLVANPLVMSTASVLILLPINFGGSVTGRAAFVTFAACLALMTALRPGNRLIWRLAGIVVLVLAVLWATEINIGLSDGERTVSFDQLAANVESIFDSSEGELEGTKQWRLMWWGKIIDYTVHGRYFWTGKGFGINLADDDGFAVDQEGSLRSPHNGHMTMLARAGVPGLALWIVLQLTWAGRVFAAYVRAYRQRDTRWAGLFMVLLVYWTAFVVNAAFDVFLEGPIGGIWFWTFFGVGMAAVWIHRYRPDVLYPPKAAVRAPSAAALLESAPPPQPRRRESAYAARLSRRRASMEMRPAPVNSSITDGSR